MKTKKLLIVLLFVTSIHLFAKDGVPFIHSFGEERVYFKDWLVVCANKGQGECRMVNYLNRTNSQKIDGFFPDSRLSITPNQGDMTTSLDFYDQNAPSDIKGITISVDGEIFMFDASDYQTPTQSRMMETYIIKNANKLDKIIQESKSSRWLTFIYQDINSEYKRVKFSLRGFAKAYEFIQGHKNIQ